MGETGSYVASSVPAALAPYVTSLVAYDARLGGPGVHRGLPSTSLTVVLPVGEPLDVGWASRPESRGRRWSTVSGLHSAPAAIHHDGVQRGVQLGLTTAGARALLGVPASALSRELVEIGDVAPDLRHLPDRVAHLAPVDAVPLVWCELAAALARHGDAAPRAEVGRALARLTRGAAVGSVADEVGLSRRRLGTLVREECGLGPKEYQRVARFDASRATLLQHGPRVSLARVAAGCGYADQAHLAREWGALAGCAPSTWLREEFPFVQAPVGDAAGG